MTRQFVKEVLVRRPFQPVRIVLAGGEVYELQRADMARLTRTNVLIGTGAAEDGVPAEFEVLSLPQIEAIEPIDPTKPVAAPQRVPDLHAGAMETSDDFDAPLPDEFWTGQS